jgi:2'-5' RNA ligase
VDPEPIRRRLFLAAALDVGTRDVLAAHLEAADLSSWPGRLVRPENWHVTLRFLGWTTELQRDQILRHLDESALPGPFAIRFAGLGAFPKPRRATVIWVSIDRGTDRLEELASACEAAAQGAGFDPEDRPYHAHLTLSRVRPPVDIGARLERFEPVDLGMRVPAVTVFESHLSRGGARYEVLDTIDL